MNRRDELHVVLVEPEIHWNTGNAGRTCLAAGARLHLVEPLGFSLDARQIRRSGLDYWPRVQPRIWPSWVALEEQLPSLGSPVFFSPSARTSLWDAELTWPTVLIFGGESRGLATPILERHRGSVVRIPQHSDAVRSLNLSTSVAIGVYEVRRRQAASSQRVEEDSGSS